MPPSPSSGALTTRLAVTESEKAKAAELIAHVYTKAGYAREGEKSSISAFLGSPASATFLAYVGDDLLGTISVISDSPMGLPMESIFRDTIAQLRGTNQIAEVAQFAIDRELLAKHQLINPERALDRAVSLSLFKLALHYGMRKGFDLFCIAVNPKHEAFYRWIGFTQFAETRIYPSVENAPAVPMKFELSNLVRPHSHSQKDNWLIKEILASPPDEHVLAAAIARTPPLKPVTPLRRNVFPQIFDNILHGKDLH